MSKHFSFAALLLFAVTFTVGCGGGGGSEPIPPSNPSAPPSSGIDADGDGEEDSPTMPAGESAS